MNRRWRPDADEDDAIQQIRNNAERVQRAAEAMAAYVGGMAEVAQSMQDLLREMGGEE